MAASLVCALALQAFGTAAAEPGENAEVVPLPEDEPPEPKTPPVPKPPPETVKAEPKKDRVKEAPREAPREPVREIPKEIAKELPKEAAKKPPKETLKAKEPSKEAAKKPPQEPAKVAPKEVAEPPVKEPPKEAAKVPAKAALGEPTADTAENVAEPPGETVPLPADKPTPSPGDAAVGKNAVAQVQDGWEAPMLTAETATVLPGQTAVFSLYGPEAFLRRSTARYVVRDEFGRHLAQGTVRVADLPFNEGKPRQIKVEIKNPLAQSHVFELLLEGADGKQTQVRSSFSVPMSSRWDSWIALIATPPGDMFAVERVPGTPLSNVSPQPWAVLRTLGIRGGLQYRLHPARREALRKGNAPFYVENIARQLLSRYHTEQGLWERTVAAMAGNRGDRAPLMRDPSLCSQPFAEAFAKELKRHAEHYAKDPPLFYSLASEPSVTRLAAAADFDFSPAAIEEFQRWLERDVYGTLKALNAAWDTRFAAWTDVVPMTTDEARLRLRDGVMNVGPWIDFREFQDHCFSKVLRDGAEFIRQYDSNAKVGITGALGPFAFGGWDWVRLARALDVVECYDIGGARTLWRDLAPGKPALAAIPLTGDPGNTGAVEACRTIWNLALEGGPRGVLLWDDLASGGTEGSAGSKRALLDAEGKPTPLAQTLAAPLRALEGETGTLLAQSTRRHDGVAVLYSPASVRLQWLFESQRLHGDKWLEAWGADTGAERRESRQLRLRESWGKLLDDLGLNWRFVSTAELESREILRPEARIKTIVLPQAAALSDREADVLRKFAQNGGLVVADAVCGRFDEHGRMREKPALDDVFQIDTATEPFAPLPMSPLETVRLERDAQASKNNPAWRSAENLRDLAPVFSDRPKWAGPHTPGTEYRRSPVLAVSKGGGVYLNLDLTEYLRWRLHPDQPRAQAVREVVGGVAFGARLAESPVDWRNTRLPAGTQVLWLKCRGAPETSRVLALRRNPQGRLHELGTETDGNWLFEKAEPYVLALREPAFVTALLQASEAGVRKEPTSAQRIAGTLDPVTPALFILSTAKPEPPQMTAPAGAVPGEVLAVDLTNSGEGNGVPDAGTPGKEKSAAPAGCLFSVRVLGPDGRERPYYALTKYAPDGVLVHSIPLALNEPCGTWRVIGRNLTTGAVAAVTVDVKAGR